MIFLVTIANSYHSVNVSYCSVNVAVFVIFLIEGQWSVTVLGQKASRYSHNPL